MEILTRVTKNMSMAVLMDFKVNRRPHNVNIKFVFIKCMSTSYHTLHVIKDYTLVLKQMIDI